MNRRSDLLCDSLPERVIDTLVPEVMKRFTEDPHPEASWYEFAHAVQTEVLARVRVASSPLPQQAGEQKELLSYQLVVAAINATMAESYERGRMFPQTRGEDEEDQAAKRRIIKLIEWHGKQGVHMVKDWPASPPAVLPQGVEAKPELSKTEREEKIAFIANNLPMLARNAEASMKGFGSEYVESLASDALGLLYEYDGVLRGLAFYLAAGGFNSEGLILPEVADAKIRYGIDHAAPAGLGEAKAVAPEGWKLVPMQATPEMEQAADDVFGEGAQFDGMYVAALAAAPVAQALPVAAEKDALAKAAGECKLVKRTSDQGVTLQFSSCRAASAFEAAIRATPATWMQGSKPL